MKIWYSVSVGDGMVASMPLAEIEERFQRYFLSAGGPPGMAVFTRSELEGRLHCELIAYFSPAASEVAQFFEAEPCQAPARTGLELLAGDPACWSVLFPEDPS